MSTPSTDNFKDFFSDTFIGATSNIIILVSAVLFIIFYIVLKYADVNNKTGILMLQILSLVSMITLVLSIINKFIPKTGPSIFEKIIQFLLYYWEYIKTSFYTIVENTKIFFMNLMVAIVDILSSIATPNYKVIATSIGALIILAMIGYMLYIIGVNVNFEKIKQHTEAKKIIYSIFIFLLFSSVLYTLLPKLYSSDNSPSYKAALLVTVILLISVVLGGFFMKEILEGNYRNYGMLLFNVLIFLAFIYFIYGIKKFFFDQKTPTLDSYSTFEYFLYYYLFPIVFLVGYILYYIYIYRDEKLSFTDFSDYRVIIFDILTAVIGFYLIYQLVIKNLLSASTDSSIIHFFQSVFKVIPCIFSVLFDYFIKNPSAGFLSVGISAIFIFLMVFISGNVDYTSWYMILLYIIGIIMFIAGMIKILLSTTSLGESKIFQLLQKTIFTLPCLFLLGMDNAFLKQKFGTTSEFLFIVMITFFIFFYNEITSNIIPEIYEKYILKNGNQIINNPTSLSEYSFISSYDNLFNFNKDDTNSNPNPNKFDYKYGLSFWFYLDSFAPLNSQLYNICCLGDGLMVKYNPVENALYFTYNGVNNKLNDGSNNPIKPIQNEMTIEGLNNWNKYKMRQQKLKQFLSKNNRLEGFANVNGKANVSGNANVDGKDKENINNDTDPSSNSDEPTEIIIHKEFGVLLQKWNNVIVNYNGGTLDVFINGKMVNSKINVVPYINTNTALTVGENNGIHGNICNLIYYKSPMGKSDIYRMYHIFKDKNPPTINKSDTNVMDLGETLEIYFSELISRMNKDNQNY